MRKRIYDIIELSQDDDIISSVYDVFMMFTIFISVIPLAFKQQNRFFVYIDYITVSVFIVDYILRILTSDFKLQKSGYLSFFIYPFTPMALIDLISILPSLTALNSAFKIFKIFRLLRTFRVFRVFKFIRYSSSVNLILNVFRRQKGPLLTVCGIALSYVLVSALIILNIEPNSFSSYFDAIYWATVSLTTMGYGDIYPVSTGGRIVTILSSFFGIAIIALPSGIITAGLMEEINERKR